MTFNIVPIPACCLSGIHNRSTPRLIKKVRAPMLSPLVIERPSANTVHGLIPTDAVIINDSPSPNKNKPAHRITSVRGFGEKFKGLSELHWVVGTALTEKIFITKLS
jgi:hypothetical protein